VVCCRQRANGSTSFITGSGRPSTIGSCRRFADCSTVTWAGRWRRCPRKSRAAIPLALGVHFREGEIWDKAAGYLRAAGVEAMARSANREAVASFEQALIALAHVSEGVEMTALAIDLRLDLFEVLRPLGELQKLSGILADAEGLAKSSGDQKRLGRVWSAMTQYFTPKDLSRAEASYHDALALAEILEMRPLQARCLLELGVLDRRKGRDSSERLAATARMFREMEMRFWVERVETAL